MKKILFYIMVMAAFILVGASNDNVFFIGSPKGELNTYSDSTLVNDGEKYALVWTTNGVEFSGFNYDGTLVDTNSSRIVAFIPAKNGKLRLTMVQIAKGAFGSGTYSLSLLDTRVKNIHTGEYEFNDGDISNVREYFVLASGYEYKEQFERMPLTQFDSAERYVANGYVEPETLPQPVEPIVQPEVNPTNMVADVGGEDGNVSEVEPIFQGGDEVANNEPVVPVNPTKPVVTPTKPTTPTVVPQPEPEEPVVVGYLPAKFTKKLVREKWKSMYKKHANENWYHVWKKNYTRTATYQKKTWIIKYSVYNIVPESYMTDKYLNKYKKRFTEHWVITGVYVMEKITSQVYLVSAYQIDENFGMIEVETPIECLKKERSKVLKMLKKMNMGAK